MSANGRKRFGADARVVADRHPRQRMGSGSVKVGALVPGVVCRARPIGFVPSEDWGEASWTARDLR